jgi:phosphoglycerol transferase MdoB-like AlkP superfamily enzyme
MPPEPAPESITVFSFRKYIPQQRWGELFGNTIPSIWVPLLIPAVLTIYALVSMNAKMRWAGVMDHGLFCLAFAVIYGALLGAPRFLWRYLLSFGFILSTSLFFLFVNLNFRFFNTWGQMDALKQWEDVFAIWTSILALMKPADLLVGLLVPLALWQWSLTSSGTFFRRSRRILALLGMALFLGQYKLTAGSNQYSDQNPLLFVFRQKYVQWQIKHGIGIRKRLGPRRFKPTDFVSVNTSLYSKPAGSDYPFLKYPIPDAPRLPFAITSQPNIVLILMESVRAFESGSYGAPVSFTPSFDRLAKEGIFFSTVYANAAQTIRSEFAIHSSLIPNARGGSVYIDQPDLGVLTLGMILKERNYSTHWIGSHPPTFDNKIKFHSQHGIDGFHYEPERRRPVIGMGAADFDLFDYAFETLKKQQQPYFAEIMTLSNHFPFAGYPTDSQAPAVSGSKLYQGYCRGIYYTDAALGAFIDRVRQDRSFDNTLFVVTGDHGVWLFPDDTRFAGMVFRQEAYFRVPLLMWSPRLSPQRVTALGSHIDIVPSVLDLMDIRIPNAFLGNSLFRDNVENRFVLMNHDTRWNLRYGNLFAYDTGPESFLSHYPLGSTVDIEKMMNSKEVDHLFFSSEKDLFHSLAQKGTKVLDRSDADRLQAFAEEGIEVIDNSILNDYIYPPHLRRKTHD